MHPHHVAYVTSSATVSLLDGKWNEYDLSEYDTKTGTRPETDTALASFVVAGQRGININISLGTTQDAVLQKAAAESLPLLAPGPLTLPNASPRVSRRRQMAAGRPGNGTIPPGLAGAPATPPSAVPRATHTHTHVIVATAVINRNINAFTYGSAVLIEKSWPKQARHA